MAFFYVCQGQDSGLGVFFAEGELIVLRILLLCVGYEIPPSGQ